MMLYLWMFNAKRTLVWVHHLTFWHHLVTNGPPSSGHMSNNHQVDSKCICMEEYRILVFPGMEIQELNYYLCGHYASDWFIHYSFQIANDASEWPNFVYLFKNRWYLRHNANDHVVIAVKSTKQYLKNPHSYLVQWFTYILQFKTPKWTRNI